ncbi:hypothetical protein ACI78Q_06020 [Geodermatophilus sp. SYSU D00705]
MTGRSTMSPSTLIQGSGVLVHGPLLQIVKVSIDLYAATWERDGRTVHPAVGELREQIRQAQAYFAIERQRLVGVPAGRTSADELPPIRRTSPDMARCSERRQDELLTVAQIAGLLHHDPRHVRRLMAQYDIPPRKEKPYEWTRGDVQLLEQRREDKRTR